MARVATAPVQRLIALLAAGDFDGDESQQLVAGLRPSSLLLRAVERAARGERTAAWDDVCAAVAAEPNSGLVLIAASRLLYVLGDYHGALEHAQAARRLGVAAGATLSYTHAREIGAYHEARAVLEDVLAGRSPTASEDSSNAAAGLTIDEALEFLLLLYCDANHYEGATAVADQYLTRAPRTPEIALRAARAYGHCGETERARDAIRAALASPSPPATTRVVAAQRLVEIGAFDAARELYEGLVDDPAAAAPALEALSHLRLWRGDVEGACALAECLCALQAHTTTGRRMRAAVHVMQNDYFRALRLLDGVIHDDPHDGEAYTWRAEARLRLGDNDAALADAQQSGNYSGDFFAAGAIRLLAELASRTGVLSARRVPSHARDGTPRRAFVRGRDLLVAAGRSLLHLCARPFVRAPGLVTHARREFAAELAAIDPTAARVLASDRAAPLAALLERALVALRGNRTPVATWVRSDGQLVLLPHSASARVASRVTLELIKVASPEEALRCFEQLRSRFPDSSMPLVHRGELHLWLGRYAEARADLEASIALHRQTRWAWYGLACLDLLAGDAERSLATCAFGIQVMDNTEGPAAYLYRGEAYRVLGRLDEAREQLRRSCALHPTRLSASINLALVHYAAGDGGAQHEVFRRLVHVAPWLVSEAARELGEDAFKAAILNRHPVASGADAGGDSEVIDRVLRRALAMMRGNRSSGCVTYFTQDGRMRYVPQRPADGGETDTSRPLASIRLLLTRALGAANRSSS